MKMNRKAFTLVELLVVISIIAILISILLPAMARARRYSYRVVCAANLSTWGEVALAYATDHQGIFPTAYGYGQGSLRGPGQSAPIIFPMALNLDSSNQNNEYNGSQWITYGTPYSTFLKYGSTSETAETASDGSPVASASEGISIPFIPGFDPTQLAVDGTRPTSSRSINLATWMVCPDSPFTGDLFAAAEPGNWGDFTLTSYMYVGGTSARATGGVPFVSGSGFNDGHTLNWGLRENKPAVHAYGSPQDVLAADTVGWSGINNGNAYFINHPSEMNPQVPDFQNVLCADGHVQGVIDPSYYDPNVNQASGALTANDWAASELTPEETSGRLNGSIGTNQSANWMFYWPNLPVGGIGGGQNGNQGQNQGGCSGGDNNQGQNQGGWSGGNNNQGQNGNQGQNQGGCSGGDNNQGQNGNHGQNQGGCSGGGND